MKMLLIAGALAMLTAGSLTGCGASLIDASKDGLTITASGDPGASEQSGSVDAKAQKHSAAFVAADAFLATSKPGSSAYKIGPMDVLAISVFKVPELSTSVQVANSGTVNLPLVGEMRAAGRTAQAFERELTKSLGKKYLQKPQVTVYVKEYNSQRVTLEGAVTKPGVYPIRGKASLLQFIAIAQGLQSTSDDTVVIFRNISGKRAAARFDIAQIRSGEAKDPAILSGDVIVAGSSALKEGFSNLLKALPLLGAFALL